MYLLISSLLEPVFKPNHYYTVLPEYGVTCTKLLLQISTASITFSGISNTLTISHNDWFRVLLIMLLPQSVWGA